MKRLLPLLVLLGCTSGADDDLTGTPDRNRTVGDIEFSAETLVMESFPVQLRTVVTARNASPNPVRITFPDGCIVILRAWRGAARSGDPAWEQQAVCTMALVPVDFAPGETKTFTNETDAREILGDSLPDGRYLLSAFMRPDGERIDVPAGAADLGVPR